MKLAKVKGDSMYPFLRDEDLVVIKKISFDKLKKGNVLVFKGRRGEYIIHRLVKKAKGGFCYLQGDGYNLSAEPIEENALIGKAIGIIRGGSFVRFNRFNEWISWGLSYLRRYYIGVRKKVKALA